MIGRLINLPFKVLGRVSRAVQDRNDQAMRARHGEGEAGDEYAAFDARDRLSETVPDDFDAGAMEVDAGTLLAEAQGGQALTFVDVRRESAWQAGRVKGAMVIPIGALHIRLAELPPDGRIVVYDDDGRLAREATRFLRFRGLDYAWMLRGGLPAWRKAGGETASGGAG